MAVTWGTEQRSPDGITAIGVDEVQWRKGHHFLTLVYQIDQTCRRLLYVAPVRTAQSRSTRTPQCGHCARRGAYRKNTASHHNGTNWKRRSGSRS